MPVGLGSTLEVLLRPLRERVRMRWPLPSGIRSTSKLRASSPSTVAEPPVAAGAQIHPVSGPAMLKTDRGMSARVSKSIVADSTVADA